MSKHRHRAGHGQKTFDPYAKGVPRAPSLLVRTVRAFLGVRDARKPHEILADDNIAAKIAYWERRRSS